KTPCGRMKSRSRAARHGIAQNDFRTLECGARGGHLRGQWFSAQRPWSLIRAGLRSAQSFGSLVDSLRRLCFEEREVLFTLPASCVIFQAFQCFVWSLDAEIIHREGRPNVEPGIGQTQ